MTRINWGSLGRRYYETGIDRGVLYVDTAAGIPWNGLTGVAEAPSGGDPQPFYLDGVKYLNVAAAEEFQATLSAINSPRSFWPCDGTSQLAMGLYATQQPRKKFGLSYRTLIGNDVVGNDFAYKLHLVYNALAQPTARPNTTVNASVTPLPLSWQITTVPVEIPGGIPASHLLLDSRTVDPAALQAIEDLLYGTEGTDAELPDPADLIAMLS